MPDEMRDFSTNSMKIVKPKRVLGSLILLSRAIAIYVFNFNWS